MPTVIILGNMLLRMMGIFRPLLGNFAVYQTAQAMMAKFFVESHFSTLFYPQLNVLVTGKPGLMLLYYPVSSLIAAIFYRFLGLTLDFWGRFQAILFFGASTIYLYQLVRRLTDKKMGLGSLVAFSLCPLTIIYGQSFQNEMATVFFSLVFIFHALLLLEGRRPILNLGIGALGWTGLLLTRPNSVYLLVPVAYWALGREKEGSETRRGLLQLGGTVLLGSMVPVFWYWHVWQVSQTETNIYSTLFAQLMIRSSFLSPLVLSPRYYQSLLDVLTGTTLTPIGLTFLLIGVFSKHVPDRARVFFLLWGGSYLLSSLVIPRKLIDHDFYLLHLVAPAAPLLAGGFYQVVGSLSGPPSHRKIFQGFLIALSLAISLRYALHPAFKTPEREKYFLEIAGEIQKVTNPGDRIVVQGTHTLLYYSHRLGWGLEVKKKREISDYYKYMNWQKLSPEEWQRRNEAFQDPRTSLGYLVSREEADYFVVSDPQEFNEAFEFASYVRRNFKLVLEKEGVFLVFNLKRSL